MGEPLREGQDNREVKFVVAGCGRMGLPMAQALIEAGVPTCGFDIRKDDAFDGMEMRFDVGEAMATASHLISVVRDVAQTEALLFRDQAVLEHAPALEAVIICSTLPPEYIFELRKRLPAHIALFDAPISGAVQAAQERRLTFMFGAAPDEADELTMLLSPMGEQFHHMGALGSGMLAKVLNNFVAASSAVSTRLVLDWAQAGGLDQTRLLNLMHDSSGQTWFGTNFETIEFAKHGYADDNSIGILAKDVACALSAAPADQQALGALLIEHVRRLRTYEPD